MTYREAIEEAKRRFPNSPSRQRDFIIGWKRQPKTGSKTAYGNSTKEKDKLRIR